MITKRQRAFLTEHPNVSKIQGRQKAHARDPQHDATVWTDGHADMAPFFSLLDLVIVEQTKPKSGAPCPHRFKVIKAASGSQVFTLDTLVALVLAEIITLMRGEYHYSITDLGKGGECDAFSLSGNQYIARRIGYDRYMLEAVHIEYTGPNVARLEKARADYWKIQLAQEK